MQLAVSFQICTRKAGWNTYQVMSDLRHFYHPSPTYYATILRSRRGITCRHGVIAIRGTFIGNGALKGSYGTYTLVSSQRQAIVNTLTRAQGPKVHTFWKG